MATKCCLTVYSGKHMTSKKKKSKKTKKVKLLCRHSIQETRFSVILFNADKWLVDLVLESPLCAGVGSTKI